MKFEISKDVERQVYVARLEIGLDDMNSAKPRPGDLKLLDECERNGSIADSLLALETITRRIEETYAEEAPERK